MAKENKAVAAKKTSAPAKSKKDGLFKRIGKYFKDVKGEFKKVVWPTRKQVINNTIVVLALVLVVAVVVWGLDFVLGWLRDLLFSING